ncbi:unnamed protein product [Linum trigynum]|uniref:Uncharacterized protein n=1 Tax=Linum trigynum TaxID=586398 RepID=A0AAV2GD39_9ROSI
MTGNSSSLENQPCYSPSHFHLQVKPNFSAPCFLKAQTQFRTLNSRSFNPSSQFNLCQFSVRYCISFTLSILISSPTFFDFSLRNFIERFAGGSSNNQSAENRDVEKESAGISREDESSSVSPAPPLWPIDSEDPVCLPNLQEIAPHCVNPNREACRAAPQGNANRNNVGEEDGDGDGEDQHHRDAGHGDCITATNNNEPRQPPPPPTIPPVFEGRLRKRTQPCL